MDVVVSSRNCEVTDRFRDHVEAKLTKLEKHDHRIIRVDVMVASDKVQRQPERAVRVELTAMSKGPVVRAEAAAEDKMAALDLALDRMASQMRKAADRRKVRRGHRTPQSVHEAMAGTAEFMSEDTSSDEATGARKVGPVSVEGDGPLVVREKTHSGTPMTVEQALYEMELVGHDFFLFVDKDSDRPSVVYLRKGYDYGVISLDVT